MQHYFIIEGCRETGNYVVYEEKNGNQQLIYTVNDVKKGGLKKSRQYIGNYLKQCGYSLSDIVPHQTVKPDRAESKNRLHTNCTVQDYIDGIDPEKKPK
ncbi:hypothetical protein G6549_27460 [Bacillus sp. MM2020_1]|nr:hypothetical protein [Bacillus sp. MM2020_1]